MSGRGILDADMAMLGRMLADGWRWWTAELEDLIPARLRGRGGSRFPRFWYRDGVLAAERAGRIGAGSRVVVILPTGTVLSRTIERPATNARDLRQMLMIEGDRLMPFGEGGGLVAGRAIGPGRTAGQRLVAVAGVPIRTAQGVAAALEEARLSAAQVLAEGSEVDFAPALQASGLLPQVRRAVPLLWVVVAFLMLLNGAAVIWRDQARVDRLRALVEAQQPAVAIAQQIGHRSDAARRVAQTVVAERRAHDALGALGVVSDALPKDAWLQHYVWDGAELRLTGYRPAGSDVATALRGTRRFSDVKSNGDDAQGAVTGATAFDLTARVRR